MLSGRRSAEILDTLSVAQAAGGRFTEAVATAEEAVTLARKAGDEQLAAEIESRLRLFRQGRRYREQGTE